MRYLSLILLLSLLSACFGGGEVVPQDHYYHLADISGEPVRVAKPFGVIAVAPLRSDALHHERMILYSLQSAPLMLNTYYYHQWTDTPGLLIQGHLIDYLRAVDFAKTIIRYGERARVDGQIRGYIQRFERVVGDNNPQVVVRLELSFIPRKPGMRHALTKVYEVKREAKDHSMEATVAAFSTALQSIYGRFVSDVLRRARSASVR